VLLVRCLWKDPSATTRGVIQDRVPQQRTWEIGGKILAGIECRSCISSPKAKTEGRRRWRGTPTYLAARDFPGRDMSVHPRQENLLHKTRLILKYDCVGAGLLIAKLTLTCITPEQVAQSATTNVHEAAGLERRRTSSDSRLE